MGHIPGTKEVEHSLKQSQGEIRSALKQINAQAGKLLAKGDYAGAEQLITVARKVGEFASEFDALRKRWREIKQGFKKSYGPKEKPLPLWNYYGPTLRIIVDLGGVAKKEAIEKEMSLKIHSLLPASEMVMKGNRPRWATMMRKALGSMQNEGFVQRLKNEWRVTPSGRKAAENEGKEKQT